MGNLIVWIIILWIVFWVIAKVFEILGSFLKLFTGGSTSDRQGARPTSFDSGLSIRVSYGDGEEDFDDTPDPNAVKYWVSANKPLSVQGYDITHGQIYVGTKLRNGRGWSTEPALINPKLKVKSTPLGAATTLGYWPSYSEISPSDRGQYLAWLAHGRDFPDIDIGFVFIFFYGLERRALYDVAYIPEAKDDLPQIRDEVIRLLQVYGHKNRSFQGYGQRFLGVLQAGLQDAAPFDITDTDISQISSLSPLAVKVSIGRLVVDNTPLSALWGLAWVNHSEDIHLRTPARRCPDEFSALFISKFNAKFPNGLLLKPNSTFLTAGHNPASNGLSYVSVPIRHNGQPVPDVMQLKRPNTVLGDLAREAEAELDAYSRWLGRNNDTETLEALSLLPADLLSSYNHPSLSALRSKLDDCTKEKQSIGLMSATELLSYWPNIDGASPTKKESLMVVQLLGGLGFGMEPDPRFGSQKLTRDTTAVIFKLDEAAPIAPSGQYSAATTLLHLAALVTAADGVIAPEEEQHLESQLEKQLLLYPEEQRRLRAHLHFLLSNSQTMAGLKKRVAGITEDQKLAVSRFLIDVALADGHVDPSEIKVLEKIYTALDIDKDSLYSEVHQVATSSTRTPTEAHIIDDAVLARKLRETEKVSTILANAFSEDDQQSEPVAKTKEPQRLTDGLDGPHSALLERVRQKISWKRSELEDLATEVGVLLDGALDTLNEWAYERYDMPLIEEDSEDTFLVEAPE